MSACFGRQRPGIGSQPDCARTVDGGVADHVTGTQEFGDACLAGELQVEERGVLQGDGRRIWAKMSPGAILSLSTLTRVGSPIDQLLDLQGCFRHLARWRQDDVRPRAGNGIEVGIVEVTAVDQGDVLSEHRCQRPDPGLLGSGPCVSVDPQTEIPASAH